MKNINILIFSIVIFCFSSLASAIEKQKTDNWCWAASVQDVMAQVGFYQSQEQIAAKLDGWPSNRPAHIQELVALLQSYGFRAWQSGRPGTPQELYRTLYDGWKLIAFVRPSQGPVGHYIVLQGIDPMTGGIISSDPWTGVTKLYSMQDLYNGWRWGDSVVVGAPL